MSIPSLYFPCINNYDYFMSLDAWQGINGPRNNGTHIGLDSESHSYASKSLYLHV